MSAASKWRGISPNAEKPYCWASETALRRAVEVGEYQGLAVYVALCRLEARTPTDKKNCFHASLAEIGQLSGLSSRRVSRYIDALCRARLIIQIKPTGAAKVMHQSCRYIILSRRDKTSTSDKTKCLLPKGQKPMHKMSVNKESHGPKGHEESSTLSRLGAVNAAPSASVEVNDNLNTWDGV